MTAPVALTVVALVVGGGGGAAEIFCKALVALINPAVAFSKAFVAFPNVPVRFSGMTLVAPVVLVDLLIVVFILDSLTLGAGGGELACARSEGKL